MPGRLDVSNILAFTTDVGSSNNQMHNQPIALPAGSRIRNPDSAAVFVTARTTPGQRENEGAGWPGLATNTVAVTVHEVREDMITVNVRRLDQIGSNNFGLIFSVLVIQ